MKIGTTNYEITIKNNGTIISNLNPSMTMRVETDANRIDALKAFYRYTRSYASSRELAFDEWKRNNTNGFADLFTELVTEAIEEAVAEEPVQLTPEEILKNAIGKLMDFFTEFNFEPNFRFLNTVSRYLQKSQTACVGYITRYFELINSPYAKAIGSKMDSKEFKEILKGIKEVTPAKVVNNRLKIYYGSQGTGKTTQALKESSGKCIVCHSAMLPSDLMEDFKFNEGKAEFVPSELYRAMVEGRPIVLDEINLLPFESLRFLQGILDGKESLIYKGNEVKIADGFMIIGTMNLTVNGMTYGLPEPLVDRCVETKKFNLTADQLLGAIM